MSRIAVAVLSLAALMSFMSFADLAQARDGCGAGRFYNGYRCVPMRGPGPRYYGPGPGHYGPGPGYGPPPSAYRRGYGPAACRPGFSVQDGVCKPYRGY